MAFYNKVSFQSILSFIVIVGLGITILWYIYKIIFALFCFDIIKIYNDDVNDNAINDTTIIDSIVQETIVVSVCPQTTNDMDDIHDIHDMRDIPIAEQV